MAGYSATPLVEKLGIKPESTLALLSAPRECGARLDLPASVRVVTLVDYKVCAIDDISSGLKFARRNSPR